MPSNREIQAFRLAIALTEGGGEVNYTQVNPLTGAYGAYQFLPGKDWNWYRSKVKDFEDADIRDPRAQDAVAIWHFINNYNDFGSWELAAIAHFGGRKRAFKAKENGIDSVINLEDDTGVNIGKYMNITMQNYKEQMQLMSKIDKDVKSLNLPSSDKEYFQGSFEPEKIVNKEAATVLDAVSTAVSEGGRKKFPMDTKVEYNSQVPKQADSYNKAMAKTDYNRFEMQ